MPPRGKKKKQTNAQKINKKILATKKTMAPKKSKATATTKSQKPKKSAKPKNQAMAYAPPPKVKGVKPFNAKQVGEQMIKKNYHPKLKKTPRFNQDPNKPTARKYRVQAPRTPAERMSPAFRFIGGVQETKEVPLVINV